jgi:hypothetical protein
MSLAQDVGRCALDRSHSRAGVQRALDDAFGEPWLGDGRGSAFGPSMKRAIRTDCARVADGS